MSENEYLSAEEASRYLGVKRATLYAYASRGLVRSMEGEGGRARRYLRGDLERLKARHDARSGHGPVAAGALRFGEPVLDTALCSITPAGHTYRGHPAVELARQGAAYESVCELLWTGALPPVPPSPLRGPLSIAEARLAAVLPQSATPLGAVSVALPLLAMHDDARFGAPLAAELDRARTLVRTVASLLALPDAPGRVEEAASEPSVARVFLRAFDARPSARSEAAVNQALVLVADHELNPSSFASRVAAGTGADLYACLGAALATFSGPKHGGACDQAEALLDEAVRAGRVRDVLMARARRGESLPGFGHPLYPQGDPRTPPLIESAQQLAPRSVAVRVMSEVVEVMQETMGLRATVDYGVVMLSRALGLPPGAATALFAVGRTAGWVAHALEQRAAGFTLRPRARYVGV